MNVSPVTQWTKILRPKTGWFDIRLDELWRYRDLIGLFVWRDFVAVYKQTVLGPLWYLIQPLLTTLVFTVIFGMVAKLPTDGLPPFLFYLSGVVMWRYFSDCLNKTSGTFIANANIFGKVYFPRLVVPISVVISNLVALFIQLLLLIGFYVYFLTDGFYLSPSWQLLLLPLLVAQMAALGLGCGILISSMTTRYRDLNHLVSFGVQLWMYATPVLYPVSFIPSEWSWILKLNPMTAVIEVFRNGAFGTGAADLSGLLLSLVITLVILVAGVVLFSRVEKKFMDTV